MQCFTLLLNISICCYLASAVLLTEAVSEGTIDRKETYVIVLLGQEEVYDLSGEAPYEVVVTVPGTEDAMVEFATVGGNLTSMTVFGGKMGSQRYTKEDSMNGTEIANKTIQISSTQEIIVQVFIHIHGYVEGYLALPVASLNVSYRVSTFCSLSGYCQMAVASTVPGITKVYLQFPLRLPEIVFCVGEKFFRSKRDRFLELGEFEVLQIEIAADLTGTYIFTDQPVAVFAGSRSLTFGDGVTHMVEQLAPAHNWGDEFVLSTWGTTDYGDIIKITAGWTNTAVQILGVTSFVISNMNQTVARRLKTGEKIHIKSDKPIQVIQFAGPNSTSPSMVVVPPVSSFRKKFLHSCGSRKNGVYDIVLSKLEADDVTVTPTQDVSTENTDSLIYSKYDVKRFVRNGSVFTAQTSGNLSFGGILLCANMSAMPMSLLANSQISYKKTDKQTKCREDLTFDVHVDVRRPVKITPKQERIHNIALIKLRIKTCGHAGIILTSPGAEDPKTVVLNIMKQKVIATKCESSCTKSETYKDDYNAAGRNCNESMSFYWIRQYRKKGNKMVCLGFGPYQKDTCNKPLAKDYVFTYMQLTGISGDVHFNYDLHEGACDKIISDWRCQDLADNCDQYDKHICTEEEYGAWVKDNCAKYCGKCHPDSFGRRFIVLTPALPSINKDLTLNYEIHITGLRLGTNLAVGSVDSSLTQTNRSSRTASFTGETSADSVSKPITVISEEDVHVTVIYEVNGIVKSYTVYPADAVGTEMMAIFDKSFLRLCYIAAIDYPANVHFLANGSTWALKASSDVLKQGKEYLVEPKSAWHITTSTSDEEGLCIRSDRPVYTYCYTQDYSISDVTFYQIPPTEYLDRKYVIPKFVMDWPLPKFKVSLRILADYDNTDIFLDGSEERTTMERGDCRVYPIKGDEECRVTSNNRIVVGLSISLEDRVRAFFILAPFLYSYSPSTFYIPLNISSIIREFNPNDVRTFFSNESVAETVDGAADYYKSVIDTGSQNSIMILYNEEKTDFIAFLGPNGFLVYNNSELCRTRDAIIADGIDNDCDGLTDEDTCFSEYGVYGTDEDMKDGGFNDDCGKMSTAQPMVNKTLDPPCMPIDKPDGQCWQVWSCKCSWVEALEKLRAMPKEQRDAISEADKERYKKAMALDPEKLSSSTSQKVSATDERQSAANVGYVGLTFFGLLFGLLVLLDLKALIRDLKTLISNLKDGFGSLWDHINGES